MFGVGMRDVILKLGHPLPPEMLQTAAHSLTVALYICSKLLFTHTEKHKLMSVQTCFCTISLYH